MTSEGAIKAWQSRSRGKAGEARAAASKGTSIKTGSTASIKASAKANAPNVSSTVLTNRGGERSSSSQGGKAAGIATRGLSKGKF